MAEWDQRYLPVEPKNRGRSESHRHGWLDASFERALARFHTGAVCGRSPRLGGARRVSRLKIVSIVEGHGEERAVPVLIRRWLEFRNFQRQFEVLDRAINSKGSGSLKGPFDPKRHVGVEHYVRAALRNEPDAILVVIDADGECELRA